MCSERPIFFADKLSLIDGIGQQNEKEGARNKQTCSRSDKKREKTN